MKKLLVVLIVFVVLLTGVELKQNFSLLDYFSGEYSVYTSTSNGKDCVDLGFCYMNSKPAKKDVVGESIKIKDFEPVNALKTLSAKVVTTEFLDDGTTVIYAYTKLIYDSVKIDNKNVNLQIAHNEEYCVIGWPLILGSF